MKKKLLIVSPVLPWPLTSGGAIAQYFFLEILQQEFIVSYLVAVKDNLEKEALVKLKSQFPKIKFLIIDNAPRLTIPNRLRLVKKGLKNVLRYGEWNYKEVNGDDFEGGYFTKKDDTELNKVLASIKRSLQNQYPDIVQVDFYDWLPVLKKFDHKVKKIAVIHELHTLRLRDMKAFSSVSNEIKDKIIITNEAEEKQYMELADELIVFNKKDKQQLAEWGFKAAISPYGIPQSIAIKKYVSETFTHLLFMGSQSFGPNESGLEWFLDEVYLALEQNKRLPLIITGYWQKSFQKKYSVHSSITFTGEVKNTETFYDGAILIVPTQVTTGVRTKILQAFANNIPVISSSNAASGLMDFSEPAPMIIFCNKHECSTILEDLSKYKKILQTNAQNGYRFWSIHFNENDLLQKRVQVLNG